MTTPFEYAVEADFEELVRHGPTVQEIHLDFLLWEELSVNAEFLGRLVRAAVTDTNFARLESVEHSVEGAGGESDLILRYRTGSGAIAAILIEDKINAGFQPRQADRYRDRGRQGIPVRWQQFTTCLVAPKGYIQGDHGFDAAIAVEDLAEWFGAIDADRLAFKRRILAEAVRKHDAVGPQTVDPGVTAFRRRYFEQLQAQVPARELAMSKPGPAASTEIWFALRSSLLGDGIYVLYKADRGFVDLTIPNTDACILGRCRSVLEYGMGVEQTGKGAAIRLKVLPVLQFDSIDDTILAQSRDAALRLCHFYDRERGRLAPIIEDARRPNQETKR